MHRPLYSALTRFPAQNAMPPRDLHQSAHGSSPHSTCEADPHSSSTVFSALILGFTKDLSDPRPSRIHRCFPDLSHWSANLGNSSWIPTPRNATSVPTPPGLHICNKSDSCVAQASTQVNADGGIRTHPDVPALRILGPQSLPECHVGLTLGSRSIRERDQESFFESGS